MRRAILIALLVVCSCGKSKEPPPAYSKVDVHTHFGPEAVPRVIELMDAHGIDVVVNLSGGTPERGLAEQLEAAQTKPGRILVFANLEWRYPLLGPGYGEAMAKDLERAKGMGAVGLKIPKGLGIGFTDYRRELIAVDEPELDPVFEMAGKLGMPVAIHTGDPVAFWQPPTKDNERFAELSAHPGWSFYDKPVPPWEDLFAALERRIARHPNTTFIAVHFGNAPEYPDRVAKLLDTYPNLYIDTAARIPEIGRHDPAKMRELFEKYQDRILFGTDLGVGRRRFDLMLGSTGKERPTQRDVDHFFASTWRYLETSDRGFAHPTPIQGDWTIDGIGLSRGALRKVYGDNARRILGL
jgi:predicted TIM-barrel fold metal-dependent hydrolase